MTYIKDFLLEVQDSINFDKTVNMMIKNKVHDSLIDHLFEQTDQAMKNMIKTTENIYAEAKTKDKSYFGRRARINLLINLVNQSVEMKKYSITYEVTKRFMSDFLKARDLPIFDILFQHFSDDMTRYEAKLALMINIMPFMNKRLATSFMKIIEEVLNQPASCSIFKSNINPLRVGLMLYRVLDNVQSLYAYS